MSREIMQQALHHLVDLADDLRRIPSDIAQTIAALEAEIAKPEQGLVCDRDPFYCWSISCQPGKVCNHTAQPEQESVSTNDHLCAMLRQVHDVLACTALPMKRPWVGLTNEEVQEIAKQLVDDAAYCSTHFAIAIEAKLKEKNNAL